MSAEWKPFLTIEKCVDCDTELYHIGELDNDYKPEELKKYIETYGEEGYNQILHQLTIISSQALEAYRAYNMKKANENTAVSQG